MAITMTLTGKSALVTGGNRGIGAAIALALAEAGADVGIVARHHKEEAAAIAAKIDALGVRSFFTLADLTIGAEALGAVDDAISSLDKIDILVNCAGGFPGPKLVIDTDEDEWDAVLASNLKSAFLCAKAIAPGMIHRGWGRIINTSSEFGRMPVTIGAAHYAASKAGLLGFTRHLARELTPYGVTVNATAPGTTYTERTSQSLTPDIERRMLELTPIGRIAVPADQTGIAVFLCTDAAGYISGATIDVSGAKVML